MLRDTGARSPIWAAGSQDARAASSGSSRSPRAGLRGGGLRGSAEALMRRSGGPEEGPAAAIRGRSVLREVGSIVGLRIPFRGQTPAEGIEDRVLRDVTLQMTPHGVTTNVSPRFWRFARLLRCGRSPMPIAEGFELFRRPVRQRRGAVVMGRTRGIEERRRRLPSNSIP